MRRRRLFGSRLAVWTVACVIVGVAGLTILVVEATVSAFNARLSASRGLTIERQNQQLLSRVAVDEQILTRLARDAEGAAASAQTNSRQAGLVIADVERTLNALCRADRCGAPPIVLPAISPAPRSTTTTTTTVPAPPTSTTTVPRRKPSTTTTTRPLITLPKLFGIK